MSFVFLLPITNRWYRWRRFAAPSWKELSMRCLVQWLKVGDSIEDMGVARSTVVPAHTQVKEKKCTQLFTCYHPIQS